MKPTRTFVLLANEHSARFFENEGPGKGLHEIESYIQAKRTRYADMPGRSQRGPGGAHHGLDRSSTEREQDRATFAAEVAADAQDCWAKGGFDRAVMAAPPKMLGALRGALDAALSGAMTAELDKDLVMLDAADLPGHFEDVIVF